MSDSDYIMIEYRHPNRGGHAVHGADRRSYGYRSAGEKFLVHREDIKLYPNLFVPFQQVTVAPPTPVVAPPPPKLVATIPADAWGVPPIMGVDPEPEPLQKAINQARFDLQLLPGVTPQIARSLKSAGVNSAQDVLDKGIEGLKIVRFVGEARATLIFKHVQDRYGEAEISPLVDTDTSDVATEPDGGE